MHSTIVLQSSARYWRNLANDIQDAVFDAQHSSAGLGARPSLSVLLSRDLLDIEVSGSRASFERLCVQLVRMQISHSFHYTAPGLPEPTSHRIKINLT